MLVTKEFYDLCRGFHQDVDLIYDTPEKLIIDCLGRVDEGQWSAIAIFLEELLSGNHETSEIQEIWWSTPAEITFQEDKELIKFLRLIINVIKRN